MGGVNRIWMIGDGEADLVTNHQGIRSFLMGQHPGASLGARAAGTTELRGVPGTIEMMLLALKEFETKA